MKRKIQFMAMLLIGILLSVNQVWAGSYDSGTSKFTAVSGNLDSNISFSTAKAGGTTTPVINSGNIRLYRNNSSSAKPGSTLTLTPKSGVTINAVTFTLKSSLGYSYFLDGGSAVNGTGTSVSFSGKTITTSVVLQNNSKDQMDVTRIQVTYTAAGSTYTVVL